MRSISLSVAAAIAAATMACPAHGQESLNLVLTCSGTDTTTEQVQTRAQVTDPNDVGKSRTARMTSTQVMRVPARMSVIIRDGSVKLKPPSTSTPWFGKRPADGYYDLEQVTIADDQISGRANFGGLFGKPKLKIDRRTGDATFADFEGGCEKAADNPAERKF